MLPIVLIATIATIAIPKMIFSLSYYPLLKNESLTAQRWRKLPADFANATQFYPKKLTKNRAACLKPKAGQLHAGLGGIFLCCSLELN